MVRTRWKYGSCRVRDLPGARQVAAIANPLLASCASAPPTPFDCTAISPEDAAAASEAINQAWSWGIEATGTRHYEALTACIQALPVTGGGPLSVEDYEEYKRLLQIPIAWRPGPYQDATKRFEAAVRQHYQEREVHRARQALPDLLARVEAAEANVLTEEQLERLEAQAEALIRHGYADDELDELLARNHEAFAAARQRLKEHYLETCQLAVRAAELPQSLWETPLLVIDGGTPAATDFRRLVCGMARLGTVRYLAARAPTSHGVRLSSGNVVWFKKGNYVPFAGADIDAWYPASTVVDGVEEPLSLKEAMALLLMFSAD